VHQHDECCYPLNLGHGLLEFDRRREHIDRAGELD
jgi:hypothetical protein